MKLEIYTDGGSKGNPGPSAIGVVCFREGKEIYSYREDIGNSTNNIAEYSALIAALNHLISGKINTTDIAQIDFFSDSTLLVNQVKGLFKIKEPHLKLLVAKVHILLHELPISTSFTHVRREKNKRADELVNGVLR